MASSVANRGAGNRGRLCRGQGHDCRAARPVVKPKQRSRLRLRAWRMHAPWIAGSREGSSVFCVGNRLLEARSSRAGNKGTAVSMLLRRPWARHRAPVYFGGDHKDFDAFSVVHDRGLAIRIGERRGAVREEAGYLTLGNSIQYWSAGCKTIGWESRP